MYEIALTSLLIFNSNEGFSNAQKHLHELEIIF